MEPNFPFCCWKHSLGAMLIFAGAGLLVYGLIFMPGKTISVAKEVVTQ